MSLDLNGRVIVYTNQVPFETDVLRTNLYNMTGLSKLIQTILGTGINNTDLVCELACTPVVPPGLQVVVGQGVYYSYKPLDVTAYGVLPADTDPNHYMLKQACNWDPVTLNTPAPTTVGNSIIHLVQAAFVTVDDNVVSRPYFNSADPSQPIFQSQPDTRNDEISITLKQGIQAVSPSPPSPDPGYIGLYYVTVTYGQTSIISNNITVVPGAPFITESLTQKVSQPYIDANFVSVDDEQKSKFIFGNNIGTANALVVNNATPYTSYVQGTRIYVLTSAANTGSATININSLGIKNIRIGASSLSGGEIGSGRVHVFVYDGSNMQLLNPVGADISSLASISSIQQSLYTAWSDSGSVNNVIVTPSPAYSSNTNAVLSVLILNTNTGAATLKNGALATQNIYKITPSGLSLLSGGEMVSGAYHQFIGKSGFGYILLNPATNLFYSKYASVYLSVDQVFSSISTILYNFVQDDSNNWYSVVTGRFTPGAGRYSISCVFNYSSPVGNDTSFYLYKNSQPYALLFLDSSNGADSSATIELNLNNSDFFEIKCEQTGGGSVTLPGTTLPTRPISNIIQVRQVG